MSAFACRVTERLHYPFTGFGRTVVKSDVVGLSVGLVGASILIVIAKGGCRCRERGAPSDLGGGRGSRRRGDSTPSDHALAQFATRWPSGRERRK